MNTPVKFILVLVLIAIGQVRAQEFKFGKVSADEILETEHPLEKDAEAAYLYLYRNTYYSVNAQGITLTTEIHKRVKIYSDEGFPYAKFEINLYHGSDGAENLTGLKAYTYNLSGKKVEEFKLDKGEIFKEKMSENRTKMSFTMPKVKEGSVVELKYRINSTYFFSIDPFNFQFGIPVNKLEAKFSAPEEFSFNPQTKGYYMVTPKQTKRHNAHTQTSDVVYSFDLSNVPSLKGEQYVDNIQNYRSGMSFELASIAIPGSYYKTFSQSWGDVSKTIYKAGIESEIKKTGYFKKELDPLLQSVSTPAQKITTVFEFVKSKMNWNENRGYYCEKGVRDAFREGSGNVADINLSLVAMLRYSGLEVNPVLVSTKSNGIPLFPTTDGFNYVIAAVELDEGFILLDATSKLAVPNLLPYRVLNWNGRLIRENGSSESIDLSAKMKAQKEVTVMAQLNDDGSLDGRIRNKYTNHRAYSFRNKYLNMEEEEYLEQLENGYSNIEVDNYEVQNKEMVYKPVVEQFEFHKDLGVEQISGKIFISPLLFFAQSENPFTSEERSYPIDFLYPEQISYKINFLLPEGYQVESMPESAKFVLPDNLGSFVYQIGSQGNMVQLRVVTDINADVVPSTYYEYIKGFFGALIEKETEKVVLSKV